MAHSVDPLDRAAPPADDTRPLRALREVVGRACAGCRGRCSAFEAVWSIALGFQTAPRCLPCLAAGLGRDADGLRADLIAYVHRRQCYHRAWDEAARLEQTGEWDFGFRV